MGVGAPPRDFNEALSIAQTFAKSGYFTDARDAAQMVVKILAGAELGFGPFASVQGVYIVKGKPSYSANVMAAKVKASGRYNYRVRTQTGDLCEIEFFERFDGKWESIGVSSFSREDARKAQTQNLDKFARNMLFARAMSNGVRWYCPDVMGGQPAYTPEELGAKVDGEGEVIDADFEPVAQPETPPPAVPDAKATAVANAIVESYRAMLVTLNRWGAGEGLEKADADAEAYRVAEPGVQTKMAAEAKGNLVKMVEAFVAQIDAENPDAMPVDLAEKVGERETLKGKELIQLGDSLRKVLDRLASDDVPADSIGF